MTPCSHVKTLRTEWLHALLILTLRTEWRHAPLMLTHCGLCIPRIAKHVIYNVEFVLTVIKVVVLEGRCLSPDNNLLFGHRELRALVFSILVLNFCLLFVN